METVNHLTDLFTSFDLEKEKSKRGKDDYRAGLEEENKEFLEFQKSTGLTPPECGASVYEHQEMYLSWYKKRYE